MANELNPTGWTNAKKDLASYDVVNSNPELKRLRDSLLSKYGNTPYAALIQNNPYAFTPELTGDTTPDFLNDLRVSYGKSAAEYYAQIQQLMLEQEYNSESAKASRLRGAGINPDLQGLGDASEASPFDMPQTSPDLPSAFQNTEQGLNIAGSIFGAVQGVLGSAMSFAQGIAQYQGRQFENFNLALKGKSSLMDETLDKVVKGLPVDWTKPVKDEDLTHMFLDAARSVADDPTTPRILRKPWKRAVSMWSRDAETNKVPLGLKAKFEQLRKEYAQNRNEAFKIFGNGFFSSDDEKMLGNFYNSIGKYSTEIEELKSKYNKARLKLDYDYITEADKLNLPKNRALAENTGYTSTAIHNQNVSDYESELQSLGVPKDSASAYASEQKARKEKALYDKFMAEVLNKSAEWKRELSSRIRSDSYLGAALSGALPTFYQAVDSWISWTIPNPDKALDAVGTLGKFF